jgi:hypothetical protein
VWRYLVIIVNPGVVVIIENDVHLDISGVLATI